MSKLKNRVSPCRSDVNRSRCCSRAIVAGPWWPRCHCGGPKNAYPPLQFVDPKTGDAIGWEYDAMNEIAKRLNFNVEIQKHLMGTQ